MKKVTNKCGECAHFREPNWVVLAGAPMKNKCLMHKTKKPKATDKACRRFYHYERASNFGDTVRMYENNNCRCRFRQF